LSKHPVPVLFLCIGSMLCSPRPGYGKEKVTFTPKETVQYQGKPESCEIRVFKDSKPDQPHVDLGIINYHDERHRSQAGSMTLDAVMPKIKARACKLGADALTDIRVTEVRRLEFAMFNVRATVVRFAQN
jgi:hypothetical protein